MTKEASSQSRSGRVVQVPLELAEFVRKVWLPANPNKLRAAAPETISAAREFIGLVADATCGAAAVSERPLWRPHTETPDTTEPVTALIAGYNDEGDEKDESFIFGIYIWRRGKWVDEDSGSTAKAPFYWRFERDLLADLPLPND